MRGALTLLLAAAAAQAAGLERDWQGQAQVFDGTPRLSVLAVQVQERRPELTLGELAELLAQDPRTVDALVDALVKRTGDLGRAWATPERRKALEDALRKADKRALDRFPVLTPRGLFEAAAAYAASRAEVPEAPVPLEQTLALKGAPRDPEPGSFLTPLGGGLLYGDRELRGQGSAYGDNLELAQALNRLASNDPKAPRFRLVDQGQWHSSVRGFLDSLLAEGHALVVRDMRFFANFGDLHLERGERRFDVMTPVYVDTGLVLPSGRAVVVPVTHSHLEISLRGRVNADLTFFFGIDGKAAFRARSTRNQRWVGGREVDRSAGNPAAALLARAGDVRRFLERRAAEARLPMGGYGPLGDCNDAHALVTGRAPYPMLRDPRLYRGDSEFDRAAGALPNDLSGPPDPKRLLDSLPFADPRDVPFREVREALLELAAQVPK